MNVFKIQYESVRHTRELLFRYCESMSPTDYVKEVEFLGGDSIRSLHAHVADCYRLWLGNRALGKLLPRVHPDFVGNVQEMRQLFQEVDVLVDEFLNHFGDKWAPIVRTSWENDSVALTGTWLFTHTITHEFHHRGQIVKLGRILGYIPPNLKLALPR